MFVEHAAVVSGVSAHVFDRVLARYLPAVLANTKMDAQTRREILATREAISRAAEAHLAQPRVRESASGRVQTDISREWMTTAQAALHLGITTRQARRLAAAGFGHKSGPDWLLSRPEVYAEALRRRNGR